MFIRRMGSKPMCGRSQTMIPVMYGFMQRLYLVIHGFSNRSMFKWKPTIGRKQKAHFSPKARRLSPPNKGITAQNAYSCPNKAWRNRNFIKTPSRVLATCCDAPSLILKHKNTGPGAV